MRQSNLFGRTLREAPADATTPVWLLPAPPSRGLLAASLYTGCRSFRVARKVEQIVRSGPHRCAGDRIR
jgi:hypothetical protein